MCGGATTSGTPVGGATAHCCDMRIEAHPNTCRAAAVVARRRGKHTALAVRPSGSRRWAPGVRATSHPLHRSRRAGAAARDRIVPVPMMCGVLPVALDMLSASRMPKRHIFWSRCDQGCVCCPPYLGDSKHVFRMLRGLVERFSVPQVYLGDPFSDFLIQTLTIF